MTKISIILTIIILISSNVFTQVENHSWKPLSISDSSKVWYDGNQIDKISNLKFEIWLLEMYKPALEFEGIQGKIIRSKTLYIVNLEKFAYGIKEVVYYDLNNSELKRFKYDLSVYEEDSRYSFPIMPNTTLDKLVKEIIIITEKKKQGK